MTESIPGIDQLHMPANMSKSIRLEIARNLKALQKELARGGAPEKSLIYHNLDGLTQEQKLQRKKMQNKDAAQRNRMKKLRMVWSLVSSIQDLYQQVGQGNRAIRALQQQNAALRRQLGQDAPAPKPQRAQPPQRPRLSPLRELPGFRAPAVQPEIKLGACEWPASVSNPASVSLDFANQLADKIPPAIKDSAKQSKIGVVELIDSLDEIMQMSMDSIQPFNPLPVQPNPQMLQPDAEERLLRQLAGQGEGPLLTPFTGQLPSALTGQPRDASPDLAFPELSQGSSPSRAVRPPKCVWPPNAGQFFNFGQQ